MSEQTIPCRKPFDAGVHRDYPHTDLACESEHPCVSESKETLSVGETPVRIIRRTEMDGAQSVTIACGRITARGEEELPELSRLLAHELGRMAAHAMRKGITPDCRVLVVGLGNADMTPDAIGPGTVRRLTVTRHLRSYDEELFKALGCCELAALSPGVLGQTGMESGEIVKSTAERIRPDLLVAVDALAARSCERLASTVQVSDGGIAPGSGVGNHRMAIDRNTMGCPVLGVGVPTVVDSATLVWDALSKAGVSEEDLPHALKNVLDSGRSFIVSPRDCDEMVERTCRLLAGALNIAFGVGE
jgi:spore protease